jgi:DNA-binding CsgD family transcriptional regulator
VLRLCEADWRAVHGFLREAETVEGPEPFPGWLLARLATLLSADFASFTELDREQGRTLGFWATSDVGDEEDDLFWRIIDQHPLCQHQAQTGDYTTVKLSDFGTLRARRSLDIYDDWYGPDGVIDEMEAGISSSPRFTKNFILQRFRRDFSERDRDVLNLLLPHLAALHRRSVERQRSAAVLAALDTASSVGVIALREDGSIGFATEVARTLLETYLGERLDAALPPPLALWLRQQRHGSDEQQLPPRHDTFTVAGEQGRLAVRYAGTEVLIVEEQLDSPRLVEGLGLTRREEEVLALVAQGKTNAEIAAALWVSPSTIRKHLEHIYEKLEVSNRTAALARAFPYTHQAALA